MPKNRRPTLTTGHSSSVTPEFEREGRVSGHVLKAVRRSVGHTQETLAERIGVDVTTLQGWESGRRPLMAVSTGQYLRLRHLLRRLGAGPHLLTQLDTALEADRFIGTCSLLITRSISTGTRSPRGSSRALSLIWWRGRS